MAERPATLGELNRDSELVEQQAWLDFFEAAPPGVRDALRLRHATAAGMSLLACPAIPITEFNRAIAVGSDELPSRRALMDTMAWLDRYAAPAWALQLGPLETLSSIQPTLAELRLAPDTAWSKFAQVLPKADQWTDRDVAGATIVDAGAARDFGDIVQSGFGLPASTAAWFAALVGRPGWHCFLSLVDGLPAGAAVAYISDRAAWAGMSTTLPGFRKRGAQGGLIAARLNAAVAAGARVITSETGLPPEDPSAGGSSYRNQKRSGFTQIYVRANLRRSAPEPGDDQRR